MPKKLGTLFGIITKVLVRKTRDPKKMWKTILGKDVKSTAVSSIEIDDKMLTKQHDSLEMLNYDFVVVGQKLASNIETRPNDNCLQHITRVNSAMQFKIVDKTYVLAAIDQLKNGKAPGPDKVTVALVKDANEFIAHLLMLTYNSSLVNSVFPDIWKLARVTPIYKSGPKTDLYNYGPISVISVFSKLLERLAHDQLFEFLNTNESITCNQSAFRKLYSTTTPLISSTDFWYENIDPSNVNLTIFLDLRKAFDTVDRDVLLKKFRAYGIRGKAGYWFESYVSNRKQFCSLNGEHSKDRNVICGIPHGSCLGPLLFIIYLNDLEKCLKLSSASIYADNTNLTIASDDVAKLVEDAHHELSNLFEWMRVNKLSLNPKKTEFMIMGYPLKTKNLDLPEVLKRNNCDVKRVDKAKYLGVIIDEKLNWEEQFRRTKGRISGGLAALKRLKNVIP